MSCRACRKLLSPYVDGELPAARQQKVAAHLAECPDCAAAAARLRRAMQAVDKLEAIEPSAGFDAGFARKLAAAQSQPQPQREGSTLWRSLRLPAFAATALAGGAVAILLLVSGGEHDALRGPASDLEIAQRLELLQDLEVVDNLDGLEDYSVVTNLEELLQEAGR